MILPSRSVREEQSLLGIGAVALGHLERPQTVTGLWEKMRDGNAALTYGRFVLALDMLYIAGTVDLSGDVIAKKTRRHDPRRSRKP